MSTMVEVDVLDVSDLRFEGGTAGSVAEEVRAQSAAGYTTALRHLDGPLQARVAPFNPVVRRLIDNGSATLVLPNQHVRAKVVVVRHPAVLQHAVADLSGVATDTVVVVANAPPRDIDGYEHYSVPAVREAALRHFNVEPQWAPIGPLVRDELRADLTGHQVVDEDWVNIIDVDAWAAPRTAWRSDRPVIGRHSRDNPQKWPSDITTLEQVYPTDGSVQVRVLGGATGALALRGATPDSWHVLPFGEMSPKDFLAGIDFFVYFHNPRWVEAFGRTILEAMASGAVAILPRHFERLFGDGALYAEPDQAQPLIRRLYADRAAYEKQVAAGRRVAREQFGHEAHMARIRALIGTPGRPGRSTVGTTERRPSSTDEVAESSTRLVPVLMVSSNGSGMGHLTRLLAYAQRSRHVRPYFVSLSQAVPIVDQFGYGYEYLPSMKATGLEPGRWQRYFAQRLSEVMGRLRPAAVVFDGTVPYEEIPQVRDGHPGVAWVWSRRGMWHRGLNRAQLDKADWFDLVVEPGDLAAPADGGASARAPATRVGPVTLLDPDELDDRTTAQRALGLDGDQPTALVTLGAGNINDAGSVTSLVIEAMQSMDVRVCVTRPEIAEAAAHHDHGVHVVSAYPLSRHYRAFDVAVSASGYNSFHELLRFGVPSLFVPNLETSLDDQRSRARYAAEQGWAHSLERLEPHKVRTLLEDLLGNGPEMVAAARAQDPGNGAGAVIAAVERLVRDRHV